VTFIKVHVALWRPSMVMSHCDVNQSLHSIAISISGYVTLRCTSKFMSHWDIHQWLCQIEMLIKVHAALWYNHCEIHQSSHCIVTTINGYCSFLCSSKFVLHCHVHQLLCRIATCIKVHVASQHPLMAKPKGVNQKTTMVNPHLTLNMVKP
jgi:hypothetical protein